MRSSGYLSDVEGEDAALQDHRAVSLCHPSRPTQGHGAQPERVEIAGRERAPYGIATPWKLLDGFEDPEDQLPEAQSQGRQYG
jgi:hypothetical protein